MTLLSKTEAWNFTSKSSNFMAAPPFFIVESFAFFAGRELRFERGQFDQPQSLIDPLFVLCI